MFRLHRQVMAVLGLALALAGTGMAQNHVIRDGQAKGRILMPAGSPPEIRYAAEELASHLKLMSGAQLEIADDPGGDLPAGSIRLAIAANAPKGTQRDGSEQGFVIDQKGAGLLIEGRSKLGVMYGVYEYLSGLGVRWFAPGDLGVQVPVRKNVALDGQRRDVNPGFRMRWIWLDGNPDVNLDGRTPEKLARQMREAVVWRLRNRMDVTYRPNKKIPEPAFPMNLNTLNDSFGHNIRIVHKWDKADIAKEPERFPLVTMPDGTQKRSDKGQICFTNHRNIDAAVAWALDCFSNNPSLLTASMSLQDTGGLCECDDCLTANGGVSLENSSDAVVWSFMNEVARRVKVKRPDRGIAFFSSYGATEMPPKGLKAAGNILGVVCHIDHNNRDLMDPADPYNQRFLKQIEALKATGAEAAAYDYTTFAASLQPLTLMNNVKAYHKLGFVGYSCEVMARSEHHIMVNWIQAQLAWNPDQDPRKLLEEYCRTYFGAAGADVLAVVDTIEASVQRIPKVTISGYGTCQEMLTDEVIATCRKALAAAAGKADGVYAKRLDRFTDTIEFYSRLAEAYRALYLALDDRTEARQKEAVARFDAAQAYWDENNLPETCSPMVPAGWINRVRNTAVTIPAINPAPQKALRDADQAALTRELFALDTVPAKLDNLVFLPSQWRFKMDIFRRGEADGWMNSDFDDARWTPLGYGFFDEQGFQRYEGTFWYRTAFAAPVVPEGKRIYMRFGALDDDGKIYINGKLAHERVHLHGNDWMRSFEFDATALIKPGASNVVAVCGRNDYGKGGLWKPVAVYTR